MVLDDRTYLHFTGSSRALAPQLMGLAFGVGQWITAAILLAATPDPVTADNEA